MNLERLAELINDHEWKAIHDKTVSEHAAALAKSEERVQKVIDAYCRYFLEATGSRKERYELSQLEIELASLAIEVRGDNFLIDFAAALEGK